MALRRRRPRRLPALRGIGVVWIHTYGGAVIRRIRSAKGGPLRLDARGTAPGTGAQSRTRRLWRRPGARAMGAGGHPTRVTGTRSTTSSGCPMAFQRPSPSATHGHEAELTEWLREGSGRVLVAWPFYHVRPRVQRGHDADALRVDKRVSPDAQGVRVQFDRAPRHASDIPRADALRLRGLAPRHRPRLPGASGAVLGSSRGGPWRRCGDGDRAVRAGDVLGSDHWHRQLGAGGIPSR